MLNQARNNQNLYHDLLNIGFTDEEFPEWWYSPARNQPDDAGTTVKHPDKVELKSDQLEQDGTLTPATPKTPVPKEEVRGRPLLLVQYSTDPHSTGGYTEVPEDSGGFTQAEIDLLGSYGIVRGQDGVWVHIVKEPSGRTIIARER